MKIINVVPTMSQHADGVASFVRDVAANLNARGGNVRIAALDWEPIINAPRYLKTFPLGWGPRALGRSPQMWRWLQGEIKSKNVDIIHNHGLWMMPNIYAGNSCINSSCKLVFSPHGAMSSHALNISPLKKKIFWELLQGPAAHAASCLHATAESEFADIRKMGFKQPICIIPCGVNVIPLEKKPIAGRRKLLFLARVHPIKGVEILLRAWREVEHRFPDWNIQIAGPDSDGYLMKMQDLAQKLNLKRIEFLGPLYGDAKLQAYRNADLYVLPTHSENFGITVAEALAAGTPVITTHGAPWSGLIDNGAGWWIEVGVAPLVACFEQALSTPPNCLHEMGKAGHDWIIANFSWERISSQFLVTYRWLLEGGETPPWVRLN